MIEIQGIGDGNRSATQTTKATTIYLDQWMWSRLARDDDMRDRFITSLSNADATMMYSFASLVELGKLSSRDQISNIKEIADEVDFAFIDVNPTSVIEREKANECTLSVFENQSPAADNEFLDSVVALTRPNAVPKMSEALDVIFTQDPDHYRALVDDLGEALGKRVKAARNDPAVLKRAKNRLKQKKITRKGPPYTQDMLRVAFDFITADVGMQVTANDWIDIVHAVVPVCYLSIVLLDGKWAHFAQSVFPIKPPNVATIYSPKQLEEFFAAIEPD